MSEFFKQEVSVLHYGSNFIVSCVSPPGNLILIRNGFLYCYQAKFNGPELVALKAKNHANNSYGSLDFIYAVVVNLVSHFQILFIRCRAGWGEKQQWHFNVFMVVDL